MALLAVHDHALAAPVGEKIRQRILRIERGALLVERRDFQIGAEAA